MNKASLDINAITDEVITLIKDKLAEYLPSGVALPKSIRRGSDYADVSVKRPFVLVVATGVNPSHEDSLQGAEAFEVEMEIGAFLTGTDDGKITENQNDYASALISLFINNTSTPGLWDIAFSGATMPPSGTATEKFVSVSIIGKVIAGTC